MAESDEEIERLWEGEEEQMAEEDKDWLIQRLREKVHDLKEQLRLISTLGHGSITGDSGPLAHLVFFNNIESMSNRYRMEMLIRSLANSVRGSQLQVEALTHYHQPSAVLISSTGGESGDEEEEGEEEEVCVVGSVEYYVDFCLDWRGIPVREVGGGVDGGKRIEWKPNEETAVLYGQVYLEPFWVDVVGEREERRRRRMGIACFNCGDDHHIKDCPEPKDLFRINVRRQEYLASLGTVGADRRYHMTSGDDRFKKFVPGKISEKLRKAIGLMNETDYPPYIYRMRALDYPPGYRILARERGLRMYDSADDAQDKDNEDTMKREDIIIYPGFNSPDVLQSTAPSYKLGCGGPPPISCTTTSEGDKNKEKLKQWLSSADSAHQKEAEPVQQEDVDDLGTLSDYEFEEAEMTAGGEEVVVGFGLRKLLKTVPRETDEDQTSPPPPPLPPLPPPPPPKRKRKKRFSLDFPPGLVHDESECIQSPKHWKKLKKILEAKKKPDGKEMRNRRKLCNQ